jgi:hypothetical protein
MNRRQFVRLAEQVALSDHRMSVSPPNFEVKRKRQHFITLNAFGEIEALTWRLICQSRVQLGWSKPTNNMQVSTSIMLLAADGFHSGWDGTCQAPSLIWTNTNVRPFVVMQVRYLPLFYRLTETRCGGEGRGCKSKSITRSLLLHRQTRSFRLSDPPPWGAKHCACPWLQEPF